MCSQVHGSVLNVYLCVLIFALSLFTLQSDERRITAYTHSQAESQVQFSEADKDYKSDSSGKPLDTQHG